MPSGNVLSLFKELETHSEDDNEFYMTGLHDRTMCTAVMRLIIAHKWPYFKPTNLRKVFRTHAEFIGVTSKVVEKCLDHSLGKIEGTDNKTKILEKRGEDVVNWSAKVERALQPQKNRIQIKVSNSILN